jgi:hypothetical protein
MALFADWFIFTEIIIPMFGIIAFDSCPGAATIAASLFTVKK